MALKIHLVVEVQSKGIIDLERSEVTPWPVVLKP